MKEPLISIIVPVYQVELYLRECLDSILSQDFSDYEVLCIYDEGTDRSLEILQEYARNYPKIQVLYGRNMGLSGARNDGLARAQGKYILFMDSDDYYPEGALETITRKMEQDRPDVLVFNAHIVPARPRAPMFYSNYLSTRDVVYEPFCPDALFRELGAKPFVWRNCFRSDFLRSNNLWFDEDLRIGEDQAFQMIAFPFANKICFKKDKLYCYRWFREGSLQYQYNLNPEVKLCGHIDIILHTMKEWKRRGIYDSMEEEFVNWAYDIVYSELNSYSEEVAEKLLTTVRNMMPDEIASRQYEWKTPRSELTRLLRKATHCVRQHGIIRAFILIAELLRSTLTGTENRI